MSAHICPWWLAYTFDNPLRRFFHEPKKIVGSYVAEGMTVLDVGCGMGYFSIGLAKIVGSRGRVIAADVQQKMLNAARRRAENAGVSNIVRVHRCRPDNLDVKTPVDFVLAFWMVHEVPSADMFFRQIRLCLKEKGVILIAEPRFHVSSKRFQEILNSAQASGLIRSATPSIRFSHSAVLQSGSL